MPFPMIPNFNLKPPAAAAEEEERPHPLKPCPRTSLQDVVASGVVVCSVGVVCMSISWIIAELWFKHESPKDNAFVVLWSNVTQFLGGKGMRNKVVWENLPQELCGEIGNRLVSRLDILRFRSVCKKWRSSLPSPTRFPLWVPPPPNCDPEFRNMLYVITEVDIYRAKWGAVYLAFEEVDPCGKFRIPYIYPKEYKFNYPMISFMASPVEPFSQLSFIAKAHHLRMALPPFDSHNVRVEGQWDFQDNKVAKKMVLISSNADNVNPSNVRISNLSVVAHLRSGLMKGRLALLRLGGSPKNWVWDTNFCSQVFEAIGTYNGQLCALDHLGRVFLMDYNSLGITQICTPSSIADELEQSHLVEADGDLYLVEMSDVPQDIVAYKLCLRLQKWIKVDIAKPSTTLLPFVI